MIDRYHLHEQMALYDLTCDNCKEEITIGDTCHIDNTSGNEEGTAKIYCEQCIEELV